MAPKSPEKPTEVEGITTRHLQVHSGLEGFDEDLDTLTSIYEELQLCSGDIANPELDLLTFASGAHYFGVLTEYEIYTPPKEEEKSAEEDSPTRATTPPHPYYQSPFRHQPSKRQKKVDWSNYAVNPDEIPSTADVDVSLRALDNSTPNDKERASTGRGRGGSKRFIPSSLFGDQAPRASHGAKASPLNLPRCGSTEPRKDSWAGSRFGNHVDEDIRKSVLDWATSDHDIYEGLGEPHPSGDRPGLHVSHFSGHEDNVVTGASSYAQTRAPIVLQDAVLDISRYANELEKDIQEEDDPWNADDGMDDDLYNTGSTQDQKADTRAYHALADAAGLQAASRVPENPPSYQEYKSDRDGLYARRSKANKQPIIGLVYLANTGGAVDYLHSGELNVGIILNSKYRRKGYALQALQIVLESAFEDRYCNRVQAIVVDGPFKHAALNVFMKSGFGHEGTRRRAFRSPYTMEFKDATYLGILATDWVLRHMSLGGADSSASSTTGALPVQRFSIAPTSLWEEMFARHQREREELLRWEETNDPTGNRRLKRTASNETIKEAFRYHTEPQKGDATDAESVYASGKSRASSVSGAGYHTSASSSSFGGGSSPAKKSKIDKGKGKQAARTGLSTSSSSSWSQVGKQEPKEINIGDYVDDSDMDDLMTNLNIPTWIANTNASIHNTPVTASHAAGASMTSFRSARGAETSSESGFSEVSAPIDDSASDTGSEASFSSLPSEASLSSGAGSNWDMVDEIEYVSDLESQSGLR